MKKRVEKVMIPHSRGTCYACDDEKIVGVRDRRPEGGELEAACKRHADPTIPCYHGCMYCCGPTRKGSLAIGNEFAHHACHKEACGD